MASTHPELKKVFNLLSVTWVDKAEPLLHPVDLISHEVSTNFIHKDTGEFSNVLKTLTKRIEVYWFTEERIVEYINGLPHPSQYRKRKKLKPWLETGRTL